MSHCLARAIFVALLTAQFRLLELGEGDTQTWTYRQQSYFISLLPFYFKIRKAA
jgi:hypothetical protein